ncbi:MAG: hypothetical protein Q9196_005264 [Gyalolechia fulgens]
MANRVQQDAFMDDSDDSCPLCVEEFDLSDKNFKPCPCGYQVCQFCYNNIKNNMNGLCPACRRQYDDKNLEWKVVSPEEQKADIALQARKKAMARQKESERKQVESLNRKHLAGLRVVQKNLVYVVGLNPKSKEEDLLKTLRGDQYFGQYGQIVKIVVSKAKENASGNSSIGVYVTFARKQDAASCIAAVDGSQNGDRTLSACFFTNKARIMTVSAAKIFPPSMQSLPNGPRPNLHRVQQQQDPVYSHLSRNLLLSKLLKSSQPRLTLWHETAAETNQ